MIYIHGGSYQFGGANSHKLAPDYFMQHNIVLVTLNYRLGALGFLSFEDSQLAIPGNAGLKDQLMALRWFKANCVNFNGDPNNITLFGNSAGSSSTNLLMSSPQSMGLFHKAILMSGTVFNYWAISGRHNYAYRLAKVNGYEGEENNEAKVLDFLKCLPAEKLVGHELRTKEERIKGYPCEFSPTIETYASDSCILNQKPKQMMQSSWSNNIPVMLGGTSFECLYRYRAESPEILDTFQKHTEYVLPYTARKNKSNEQAHELGHKMLKYYLGDKKLSMETILEYLKVYE